MQLVVQSGAEPGKTYDLNVGTKLSIGRQSSNQIVVSDEQVSRKHSEIEMGVNGVTVTDLDSSNGTFVNGTRINSPIILKTGDTLQVGTTVLKLVDNQAAARTMPPASFDTIPASDYRNQQAFGAGDSGGASAQPPAYSGSGGANYSATPEYGGYNQPAPNPASYSPQAPSPAAYNQPPAQPDYAQANFNQNQPPSQAYGYQSPAAAPGQYNQPPYGQPPGYPQQAAPAPVTRKKGGLPLPLLLIIGGIVLLLILGIAGFTLLGGSKTAELPDPTNATKIELSSNEQTVIAKEFKETRYNFYTSKDSVAALETYYKDKMAAKGYNLDKRSQPGQQLVFINGDKAALVLLSKLDAQAVSLLSGKAASFQGKLKEGDTLVGLAEGKTTDITG